MIYDSSATPLFHRLTDRAQEQLTSYSAEVSIERGAEIIREGEESDALWVIKSGTAQVTRGALTLTELGPGDCFGELGLLTSRPRAGGVRALTDVVALELKSSDFKTLTDREPALGLQLMAAMLGHVGRLLTEVTDTLELVLHHRSRPKRSMVKALVNGNTKRVKVGTRLTDILPRRWQGRDVVAAALDGKPVSLRAGLFSSARITPITRDDPGGTQIVRTSIGLVLLEAAHRLNPELRLRIGPSLGFAHLIEVDDAAGVDLTKLAHQLTHEMEQLVAKDVPIRQERWTVAEAQEQFRRQGWTSAAHLLRTRRTSVEALVSCGELLALENTPMAPSTGLLGGYQLVAENGDLLLYFGDAPKQPRELVNATHPGRLAREHEHWLNALGANSVGAFNDLCISGRVSEIIRVSEGFHEKRISQLADEILHSKRPIRAICLAGPSSAGKTTFINRLSVQLQVNGLRPRRISLDDYYLDREKTARDERGEFDFEAYQALDSDLLDNQLERILRGDKVQTAHFDFKTGSSDPDGGPTVQLGKHDVLMIEGLHALNSLIPIDESRHGVFRIFLNPMTSLPLDAVARVSVSDVRLLRRIVRDRHGRATNAADSIRRWRSVRRGERRHIFPFLHTADASFNSSLIYEVSVLKVYADRYLLEVPTDHPSYPTAYRLRRLIDQFVTIYPDQVPPTSLLREFIG